MEEFLQADSVICLTFAPIRPSLDSGMGWDLSPANRSENDLTASLRFNLI